jgi:hypothetical protein
LTKKCCDNRRWRRQCQKDCRVRERA